jgi:hypothetical protein
VDCSSEFDDTACKLKLVDGNNNCYGTVLVECGNTLKFFFNSKGQYDYCNHINCRYDGINEGDDRIGRTLMEAEAEADVEKEEFLSSLLIASGGGVADFPLPPSLGEGVESMSSSLRGVKGSKRIL